jgi:four helix bundle protein
MDQQEDRPELPQQHFDHHRLDAWRVAFEALLEGDRISKALPRGYGKLKDQLQRALQGAFTLTSEAAARTGADRACRFRWARGEANEAAAVLQALAELGVAEPAAAASVIGKLWRLSAMLTRLAMPRR